MYVCALLLAFLLSSFWKTEKVSFHKHKRQLELFNCYAGLSPGRVNFFSAAAKMLCFEFQMRMVLITR